MLDVSVVMDDYVGVKRRTTKEKNSKMECM